MEFLFWKRCSLFSNLFFLFDDVPFFPYNYLMKVKPYILVQAVFIVVTAAFLLAGCESIEKVLGQIFPFENSPTNSIEQTPEQIPAGNRDPRAQNENSGEEKEAKAVIEENGAKETEKNEKVIPPEKEPPPAGEPSNLRELLQPFIQLSLFNISFKDYDDFVLYNVDIFTRHIFSIFSLQEDSYSDGQGTILRLNTGEEESTLEKVLLQTEEDGSQWWQIRQILGSKVNIYEALISPDCIPLAIRYENPATGERYEYIPSIVGQLKQASAEGREKELLAMEKEALEADWNQEWQLSFNDPELIGKENIKTPAGRFKAYHIQDIWPEDIRIDYWVSPEIPGGIVMVRYTDSGKKSKTTAELTAVKKGYTSLFDDSDLIPIDAYAAFFPEDEAADVEYSPEGDTENPVPLTAEELYRGQVGLEKTSYYSFTMSKRADVYIEVSEFKGYAELFYYGTDARFEDWVLSSTGSTLELEDYFLDAGTTVYFAVKDNIDPYSLGESYYIYVYDNPILSLIGVMIKCDIYREAFEIKAGKPYIRFMSRNKLNYYKTIIGKGNHLRIKAENLPDDVELIWFDTENGSYSEVYTSFEGTYTQIDVRGVNEGTVCYYYLAGDPDENNGKKRFTLTVTELTE